MIGFRLFLMTAIAGAVWFAWKDWQDLRVENARLKGEIAAATRVIEQKDEARKVEAARAEFERRRAAQLDANIQAIVDGGIPDAPLDPRLADLINSRLRGAEDRNPVYRSGSPERDPGTLLDF